MVVGPGFVVGPVRLLKLNRTKKWFLSEKSWSSPELVRIDYLGRSCISMYSIRAGR